MKGKWMFFVAVLLLVPILGFADSGDALATAVYPGTNNALFRVGTEGQITQCSTITCTGNETVAGTLAVTGAVTVTGALTNTGAITVTTITATGSVSSYGKRVIYNAPYVASGGQVAVELGDTLTANGEWIAISVSSDAITSIATPFLSTSTATNGQIVTIFNTGSNDITLTDNDTTSGTQLELSAVSRNLDQYDTLTLKFISTTGKWYEIAYNDISEAGAVIITAAEGIEASLTLKTDEGDNAGDKWTLQNTVGNVLEFRNDVSAAGVAITSITTAGAITTRGAITSLGAGSFTGTLTATEKSSGKDLEATFGVKSSTVVTTGAATLNSLAVTENATAKNVAATFGVTGATVTATGWLQCPSHATTLPTTGNAGQLFLLTNTVKLYISTCTVINNDSWVLLN